MALENERFSWLTPYVIEGISLTYIHGQFLRSRAGTKLKRTKYGRFRQHMGVRYVASLLRGHFVPQADVQQSSLLVCPPIAWSISLFTFTSAAANAPSPLANCSDNFLGPHKIVLWSGVCISYHASQGPVLN